MSISAGSERLTKSCELTVHLVTGVRIEGMFHLPADTSSAVRPSDAIRNCKDGYLLLTNAIVHEPTGPRKQGAIMVCADAVSHIDLPAKGWSEKAEPEVLLQPQTVAN